MRKTQLQAIAWLLCLCLCTGLAACTAQPPAESQAPAPSANVPSSAAPSASDPVQTAEAPQPTAYLPLGISEVMTSNKSTLADDAGQFPDWVELYNYGSDALSLSGLTLCCGEKRWSLPSLTLEPGGYYVVFCDGSGSDEKHASFSIPKEGCVLTLENADGALIERFDVPESAADHSVYRSEDGNLVSTAFATPGFENSLAGFEQFQSSLVNASPLLMNEVMVYNQWFLPDGGEYYDWVELKNVSDQPVSLGEYYLSDSGSNRAKYALPAFTLAPGETYVVLCTGDGELSTRLPNAPFALNAQDEHLYLSYADGTLCDYVHLHDVPYGGSCGRLDGQNGFFYFTVPSPQADNSGGARSEAEKPLLLGSDGVYDNVESVTVTLAADGEIHYTTDGSEPSADSPLYTEPLVLTETTVIRAIHIHPGQLNSDCLNLSYIINEYHSLPVVSLVAEPSYLFGGGGLYKNPTLDIERPGSVTLFEDGGGFSIDCGIKLHGATSKLAQSKKSFKLCFRSRYEGELNYNLFDNGVTEFSSILLRAAQESTYSTLMRDNLMHQLAIQSFPELPAQDYKYAVLYINGEYWGVYNIREAHSTTHYANHYGYDEDTVTQWKEAWDPNSSIAEVCRFALNHNLANDDNYNYVAQHINIDSVIGWCIIQAWCANHDCNPPNMRFYYSTEDDMMRFALVDLDLGMYDYDVFDVPLNGSIADGFRYSYAYNDLARRLMQNKQFQLRMAEQLSAALTGPMSNENVLALIDKLADELRPEIQRDRERWALGGSADNVDYWEHGYQMIDYMRDYVTRKGGRAMILVNSFLSHADLTAEEKEQYFREVQ